MGSDRVLLASASPRRQRLLRLLLDDFSTESPDVDEVLTHPIHRDLQRLATDKSLAIDHDSVVIAADTVLMFHKQILGKPADRDGAVTMLQALSGESTTVLTAVAVRNQNSQIFTEVVSTQVVLRDLTLEAIQRYVDTGAADDKAGALEIQDRAAPFVTSITGCRANLFGLPLCAASRLLSQAGVQVEVLDSETCCSRSDLEEYLHGGN